MLITLKGLSYLDPLTDHQMGFWGAINGQYSYMFCVDTTQRILMVSVAFPLEYHGKLNVFLSKAVMLKNLSCSDVDYWLTELVKATVIDSDGL
jgi:hypothetical protein